MERVLNPAEANYHGSTAEATVQAPKDLTRLLSSAAVLGEAEAEEDAGVRPALPSLPDLQLMRFQIHLLSHAGIPLGRKVCRLQMKQKWRSL